MKVNSKATKEFDIDKVICDIDVRYYVDCSFSKDNGETWEKDFEDDENWAYDGDSIMLGGYWTPVVARTLNRMSDWYMEHVQQGFNENWKWVSKLIKQPKEESIFKENGESACPVLGAEPQIISSTDEDPRVKTD